MRGTDRYHAVQAPGFPSWQAGLYGQQDLYELADSLKNHPASGLLHPVWPAVFAFSHVTFHTALAGVKRQGPQVACRTGNPACRALSSHKRRASSVS